MKTFIKWSGNKSKYVKHILPHVPESYNTYIEPFVGSGAMFLNVQPPKWIINDLNTNLIDVWKSLKDAPLEPLFKGINTLGKRHKQVGKEASLKYYRELTQRLKYLEPYQYLVLKNLVYMGVLLRGGKPYFRGYDMSIHTSEIPYPFTLRYKDNLTAVSEYLRTSKGRIYNKDYKDILKRAKPGDFCFIDPPYIEKHSYDFNYNLDEKLDDAFLLDLRAELDELNRRGVKWIMTQANTKEIKTLFKDYKVSSFRVYRNKAKLYKKELIIKNF
jgi:DNA adenine methylase